MRGIKTKKFKASELFWIENNPQINKSALRLSKGFTYPYFSRTRYNNGVSDYVEYYDEEHLIKGNCLAVGMLQMKFFYLEKDFYSGQFTKSIRPRKCIKQFDAAIAMYFSTWFNSASEYLLSTGLVSDFDRLFNKLEIDVPVDEKLNIDLEQIKFFVSHYIEDFNKCINESSSAIIKDHSAINNNTHQININPKYSLFKVQKLFNKVKVKNINTGVSSAKNQKSNTYNLPALTAGIINQGLANYVPRDNVTIIKNAISVSSNGENSGAMFYQPWEFTVLQDSYAIQTIDKSLSPNCYLFLLTSLQKRIRGEYSWTNKAGWERVKSIEISLPVKQDGSLDVDFMENYINKVLHAVVSECKDYFVNKQIFG